MEGVSGRGGTVRTAGGGSGAGLGAAITGETIPGTLRGISFLTRSFVLSQIPERRIGAALATFALGAGAASKLAGRGLGRAHPHPPIPASVFPSIQS